MNNREVNKCIPAHLISVLAGKIASMILSGWKVPNLQEYRHSSSSLMPLQSPAERLSYGLKSYSQYIS